MEVDETDSHFEGLSVSGTEEKKVHDLGVSTPQFTHYNFIGTASPFMSRLTLFHRVDGQVCFRCHEPCGGWEHQTLKVPRQQ